MLRAAHHQYYISLISMQASLSRSHRLAIDALGDRQVMPTGLNITSASAKDSQLLEDIFLLYPIVKCCFSSTLLRIVNPRARFGLYISRHKLSAIDEDAYMDASPSMAA